MGRSRRRKRPGRRARLNNNVISKEQSNFADVNYDGLQQWDDDYGGRQQQQFAEYYETAPIYDQNNFELNQNYEDYEAYYNNYENGTSANWQETEGHGNENGQEKSERPIKQYFCDLCKINCYEKQSYQSHLAGKTHRKKLDAQQQNADPDKEKPTYRCELCSVNSVCRENFEAHIKGQRHQKALKLAMKTTGTVPSIEYFDISTNNPTTSSNVSPSVNVSSIAFSESLRQFNDQCVREKVAQIELSLDELYGAEQLMQRVEGALFAASEFLMEDNANDHTEQPKGLLRGIMRVGLMPKNQLLKSDRRIDLVLLCSVVPTSDLLFQIAGFFRQIINRIDEPYVYVIENVSESAIFVSQIDISVDVYVTLTCSTMRQWSPGDLKFYPYEEPPNALPSEPCLNALAEMRRTKFYQVKCASLTSMGSLVKIMRDIKRRVPAWQVLTDWMMELVVEKVLSLRVNFASNESDELCPGDALLAFFNAISDGVVLEKGSLLVDPCEKLPVDVLASVSDKDRMNIFNSARYAIRQIRTNKMAKLLAMDGSPGIPSEHPPKRRKTMAQNSDSGVLQTQFVGFEQQQPMGSGGE